MITKAFFCSIIIKLKSSNQKNCFLRRLGMLVTELQLDINSKPTLSFLILSKPLLLWSPSQSMTPSSTEMMDIETCLLPSSLLPFRHSPNLIHSSVHYNFQNTACRQVLFNKFNKLSLSRRLLEVPSDVCICKEPIYNYLKNLIIYTHTHICICYFHAVFTSTEFARMQLVWKDFTLFHLELYQDLFIAKLITDDSAASDI